ARSLPPSRLAQGEEDCGAAQATQALYGGEVGEGILWRRIHRLALPPQASLERDDVARAEAPRHDELRARGHERGHVDRGQAEGAAQAREEDDQPRATGLA